MSPASPIVKDLVLLGGGHSHVIVLRMLAMNPIPGLQVTLISPDTQTPYSGMLPGVVAGHYSPEDIHIDLVPLCRFAGARFIQARAIHIDTASKQIECEDRPALDYDILSINVGITPSLNPLQTNQGKVIPVKPISEFVARWQGFLVKAQKGAIKQIGIVGAGAGGVELCLAIAHRLKQENLEEIGVHLITDEEQILTHYPLSVQNRFLSHTRQNGVALHTGFRVVDFAHQTLTSDTDKVITLDDVFWVTAAASQGWLSDTNIDVDEAGFIKVRATLQTSQFDEIFAVGDIAHVLPHPRPKAGVYAVRQGPVLYNNIRRVLLNKPPQAFKPQQEFLALISTGKKHAVASRNGYSLEGAWVWYWKNWIDAKFMKRFSDLPAMKALDRQGLLVELDDQMQCGGCGSKVSGDLLHEVLQDVGIQPNQLDDAAVFEVPTGKLMLHSIDTFKSFIDDPFILSQIAVHHALSDIYAMGGEAVTALATITVPYGTPAKTKGILKQLLSGAKKILDEESVELIGGHTTEGAELSIGFAVNGTVTKNELMTKAGLLASDVIVVTKPLGTGVLFAADMQYKAKGEDIAAALDVMNQSNKGAMQVFKKAGAKSCTDVTGFGLGGHLLEMLRASVKTAVLDLDLLPILTGAIALFHQSNIHSTLQEGNQRSALGIDSSEHKNFPMLFDPQTSGGLVAGIAEDKALDVVQQLRDAGYVHACVIGRVIDNKEVRITFK